MKQILIIGGYGNAGRQIAQLLLQARSDTNIVIAGRNEERARQCADALRAVFPERGVQAARLDILDSAHLFRLVSEADFVVNASGTPLLMETFIQALLQTGKDGLDTQLSTSAKHRVLEKY
ncbi:MAG TPA: saccharopine dehydrogenase NADP-binding domain-containing protein, partial [Saprospiraceae bacterium]|nr:saccharopine dehydrogenase NADP-binding domain-containing protein [Saprospiraceae bacterium]